ncbi:hypothetical protein SAMN05421752_11924 [Natronorubrum thiooxidans]|uniref:Uncharacterized protein n=1 Tax=Natronorubrum thiooxidans TaxID=308853 RepID=A0A1N7H028_9EURY|nr:hypothetical protein SAMN05421752_11924 [Natronorubrum thiooxidans]
MNDRQSSNENSTVTRSDNLSAQDFAQNNLPQRPVRFRSEYRRDLRHFAFICSGVAVVVAVLFLFYSF